jgi:hypothetical protein
VLQTIQFLCLWLTYLPQFPILEHTSLISGTLHTHSKPQEKLYFCTFLPVFIERTKYKTKDFVRNGSRYPLS